MGLCRTCEQFDIRQVAYRTASLGAVRIALDAIREGTFQECEFCLVLVAALRRIAAECASLDTKKEYLYLALYNGKKRLITNSTHPDIVMLGVWLEEKERNVLSRPSQKETKKIYLPVVANLSDPAATSRFIRGRFSGLRTDSPETVSIISEWLERCALSHRGCSSHLSTSPDITHNEVFLPNRCLEVTHKFVRLSETKGKKGRYVILSHRWSRATQACRTTTKNYEARLRGREMNDLTRTFNHAIDITLKLGFRYLWIDSMCIIQRGDDGKDWNEEVTRMSQYYQQAVFTVFATRSQKEGAGVFVSRQQPFVPLARLPFHDRQAGPQGHFYVTDRQDADFADDFIPQVRQQGFFDRGWIFQEWFLSTRIVYFTSRCVWFECKSGYPVMENQEEVSHSRDTVTSISGNGEAGTSTSSFFKASFDCSDLEPDDLWYSLVQLYSGLRFTYPEKDRIIAFSGVAKTVRDMFVEKGKKHKTQPRRYEYLAGIWLRDIHHGLLWYQKHPQEEYTPLLGLPTWSWASSMHAVSWFNRSGLVKPALTVTALATKSPSDDAYLWFTLEESTLDSQVASLIRNTDGQAYSIGPFDVDNKSCRLRVLVKMLPLLVGRSLDSQQMKTMRTESDCHGDDHDTLRWYSICSEADTGAVGGWAVIEMPYLVAQLQEYTATMIVALHISTRTSRSDQDYYFSTFRPKRTVFDVLLVEHTGDNCYRRVGRGCAIDEALKKQFDESEFDCIDLI